MSSKKARASIRHGGPGASHENAKQPPPPGKPSPAPDQKKRSQISGGGGERDSHHTRDAEKKGGGSRLARNSAKELDASRNTDVPTRNSEQAVSRGGVKQESRDHNKHNHDGQPGHKAREPS